MRTGLDLCAGLVLFFSLTVVGGCDRRSGRSENADRSATRPTAPATLPSRNPSVGRPEPLDPALAFLEDVQKHDAIRILPWIYDFQQNLAGIRENNPAAVTLKLIDEYCVAQAKELFQPARGAVGYLATAYEGVRQLSILLSHRHRLKLLETRYRSYDLDVREARLKYVLVTYESPDDCPLKTSITYENGVENKHLQLLKETILLLEFAPHSELFLKFDRYDKGDVLWEGIPPKIIAASWLEGHSGRNGIRTLYYSVDVLGGRPPFRTETQCGPNDVLENWTTAKKFFSAGGFGLNAQVRFPDEDYPLRCMVTLNDADNATDTVSWLVPRHAENTQQYWVRNPWFDSKEWAAASAKLEVIGAADVPIAKALESVNAASFKKTSDELAALRTGRKRENEMRQNALVTALKSGRTFHGESSYRGRREHPKAKCDVRFTSFDETTGKVTAEIRWDFDGFADAGQWNHCQGTVYGARIVLFEVAEINSDLFVSRDGTRLEGPWGRAGFYDDGITTIGIVLPAEPDPASTKKLRDPAGKITGGSKLIIDDVPTVFGPTIVELTDTSLIIRSNETSSSSSNSNKSNAYRFPFRLDKPLTAENPVAAVRVRRGAASRASDLPSIHVIGTNDRTQTITPNDAQFRFVLQHDELTVDISGSFVLSDSNGQSRIISVTGVLTGRIDVAVPTLERTGPRP